MAKPRTYRGRSGFNFRCDNCDAWLEVGFDRLDTQPIFECYQCGASITVKSATSLVTAARKAEAAMQAVHEEMDECDVFNSLELLGEAKLLKVTWGDDD